MSTTEKSQFFSATTINQSIKVPYPSFEHGRPYKRTFDMLTCLVPSGLGPVSIRLTILLGRLSIVYALRLFFWGLASFIDRSCNDIGFYNRANLQRTFELRCLWLPFAWFESCVKILQIWARMLSFSQRECDCCLFGSESFSFSPVLCKLSTTPLNLI